MSCGCRAGSLKIYMGASQELAARKGNVLVVVTYVGLGDPSSVRPTVAAIGARAVDAIRLS